MFFETDDVDCGRLDTRLIRASSVQSIFATRRAWLGGMTSLAARRRLKAGSRSHAGKLCSQKANENWKSAA